MTSEQKRFSRNLSSSEFHIIQAKNQENNNKTTHNFNCLENYHLSVKNNQNKKSLIEKQNVKSFQKQSLSMHVKNHQSSFRISSQNVCFGREVVETNMLSPKAKILKLIKNKIFIGLNQVQRASSSFIRKQDQIATVEMDAYSKISRDLIEKQTENVESQKNIQKRSERNLLPKKINLFEMKKSPKNEQNHEKTLSKKKVNKKSKVLIENTLFLDETIKLNPKKNESFLLNLFLTEKMTETIKISLLKSSKL